MRKLPLSDRIMFVLSRQTASIRGLSQLFQTDLETVRKTVWGLETQCLVERADDGPPIIYRIVDGVTVDYRPSRVIIGLSGEKGPESPTRGPPLVDGSCSAVTTRGTRCKLRAVAGAHCSYHAPHPEP